MKLKIFAAGIFTETNTFSPIPTSYDDFLVQRGSDALKGRIDHPTLDLSATWGQQAKAGGEDFIFSLMAFAQPAGITIKSAYELLRDEMLSDLREAMPVDIVLLNLHGAMVAQGYDDCEEDIIRRVRNVVGTNAIIGVELDLHCHLSESMIEEANIVITYKEYPHIDVNERSREVYNLAIATKQGRIRPKIALFDCQMAGLYPTTRQPLRSLVDSMMEAERRNGVLSVSFGHGFQFADVPHVGAKVLVVTDNDTALAQQVAREFGSRIFERRQEIGFESLSMSLEKALSLAMVSKRTPVVVADQSDNAGVGAPGDATFALQWLLDHQAKDVAMALLYDPEVVSIAKRAGTGSTMPVRLGGKLGLTSGTPVDIEVNVLSIRNNYQHAFPQKSGKPWWFSAGDVVALRVNGIDIVVSSQRCQCFCPSVFTDLGIDPKRQQILVVKSTQHFYGGFAPIAGDVIYMSGPGATAPDPRLNEYRRLNTTRLYPWSEKTSLKIG